VEVTAWVDAPAARVWEVVGDPARIGEISPECERVRWLDGSSGPAEGARFAGYNRKGLLRWTTTSTIAELEPERSITWDVDMLGQSVARWGFRLESDGERTKVVQTWKDRRNPLASLVGKARTTDSPGHNRTGMERTLATLKRRVEGGAEERPNG
jgi:uncharacterized protein YndB with AHSA1/START domain